MPLGQFAIQVERPHIFDARRVAPRFRQEALVAALGELRVGEAMRSIHDADPEPLLASLRAAYGEGLAIVVIPHESPEIIIDLRRLPPS